MKYATLQQYLDGNLMTREDMKGLILRSALELLGDCARNFNENANVTEKVAEPLFFFSQILDEVE